MSPSDPTVRKLAARQLPWSHLIQYTLGPGMDPQETLRSLRQLSVDSKAHVPGYDAWDVLGYAPRPQGVTLGPWMDFAGVVPFPSLPMLQTFLNYTAFHSARHASAVRRMAGGAHVMYVDGVVSPATFLAPTNLAGLPRPAAKG